MIVKCIKNIKKYKRNIESMGEGLVLFEISAENKRSGLNYHLFYGDGRKPAIDIAINPDDNSIEYISFFAMNEKIVEKKLEYLIEYKEDLVTLKDDDLNLSHKMDFQKEYIIEYDLFRYDDCIIVLKKGIDTKSIEAYLIDNSNYLLLANRNIFCGILLRNITEMEMQQVIDSDCM